MNERPRVGISRCLLGERVRYDGGHKLQADLVGVLGRDVEWVPVCPEVEMGMSTPREPIDLVASAGGVRSARERVRLVGVETGRDYTEAMHTFAGERARELAALDLSGYVLKRDSPSCGAADVRVHHEHGRITRTGRGLFAEALLGAMPGLPLVEEDGLEDVHAREVFLERVRAYRESFRLPSTALGPETPDATFRPALRFPSGHRERQSSFDCALGDSEALEGSRGEGRRDRAEAARETSRPVDVLKVGPGSAVPAREAAATEEPLEIRLDGASFVVIMRTPGADRELAAGFLLAERVITGPDDLGVIRHCVDPEGADAPNVLNVTLAGEARSRVEKRLADRRLVTANSSCGVCGRTTIEDLLAGTARMTVSWRVPARRIAAMPEALRAVQRVFDETGGLHAAALFDRNGLLVAAAEDVGRHNAVDKVIGGQLLVERLPLDERILFVSGRTSYEIVQKAIVARIPIVASVSAPSSLAIDLARDARVTLLGFVRGATFNVYAGSERVEVDNDKCRSGEVESKK